MIENYIDHSDEKKARKSLLAVAISTIFLANLKLGSEKLDLFGLVVVVDQEQFVSFGKIATSVLFVVFVFRSVPIYFQLLQKLSLERVDRSERLEKSQWAESWGFDTPIPPAEDPNGELEELSAKFKDLRAVIEERYSRATFVFSAMAVLVVDFGIPILTSLVAVANPELIQHFGRSS